MSGILAHGRAETLRRDLNCMMADGASYSVMVGVGETYVPAFALALGLGEVAAGLIATLPMLAGGMLQLISPWAVRRLGSHRRWVVTCAAVQAVGLLLMMAMALLTEVSPWLLFLPATLYWAAGFATGPAWNAWVERLVPGGMRAKYFAQRTRVSHICVLVGLVAGGFILRGGAGSQYAVVVFALLFAVAGMSRLFSAFMLASQSEPAGEVYLDQNPPSYRQLLFDVQHGSGLKLVWFLLAIQVAVHLSGPYFTPFMLVQLELTYLEYMFLLCCGFLGKILALPWAGRFAKRHGAVRLLWMGSVGIVPLAGMWLVSNSIPFLVVLQIAGGMAWAAYELAMLLLFFETIPRRDRVAMLSLYNAGNATAIVVGALLGAGIMHLFPGGREPYLAVFACSSLARLAALLLIPRQAARPAALEPPAGLRTVAVRPMSGGMERPILNSSEAAMNSSV